jgi:chromosome partitioning protein
MPAIACEAAEQAGAVAEGRAARRGVRSRRTPPMAARPGHVTRLAAVTAICAALAALSPDQAAGQGGGSDGAREVRPPTELLREYPFGEQRLRSRKGGQRAPAQRDVRERDPAQPAVQQPVDTDADAPVSEMSLLVATALILVTLVTLWALRRPAPASVAAAAAGGRGPLSVALRGMGHLLSPVRDRARKRGRKRHAAVPDDAPPVPARVDAITVPATVAVPEAPVRSNSYAVANQKGGVGKTTITLVLGAALARRGRRVLVVDLDPQGWATRVLGASSDASPTVADVLLEPDTYSLADAIIATGWGVHLAPSELALRSADLGVVTGEGPVLAQQLTTVAEYDFVLMDCPPSLGALTIEALSAASRVLTVTEPAFFAREVIEELFDTQEYIAAEYNPRLEIAGVILNRVEATAEHKRCVAEVEGAFRERVWRPHIPKRAVLPEAMRKGVPPQSLRTQLAEEMTQLFDELAERLERSRVDA